MSDPPVLDVLPARFSFEDPWRIPPNAASALFRRSTDGSSPRLNTTIAAYYERDALFAVFDGEDDQVVATYRENDAPIYREDVVEVFLAPATLTEYFEVDVNPLATMFDARIHSPAGDRASMKVDSSWNCEDAWTALRRDFVEENRSHFIVTLRIPFPSLGRNTPTPGETWRVNFYRIDRASAGDEYSAWSPTMKNPADFHVPAAFGYLRFGT